MIEETEVIDRDFILCGLSFFTFQSSLDHGTGKGVADVNGVQARACKFLLRKFRKKNEKVSSFFSPIKNL